MIMPDEMKFGNDSSLQ